MTTMIRIRLALAFAICSTAIAQQYARSTIAGGAPPPTTAPAVADGIGRPGGLAASSHQHSLSDLPMSFEANRGQFGGDVQFLAHAKNYDVWLTSDSVILDLGAPAMRRELAIEFRGANPRPEIERLDVVNTKTNYYFGAPTAWLTQIPHYSRLVYREVYPGIDIEFRASEGDLEFNIIVHSGGNPESVKMHVRGADRLAIAPTGDLEIQANGERLVQRRPYIYQDRGGSIVSIGGAYLLQTDDNVEFKLSGYAASQQLVIDPTLSIARLTGTGAYTGGGPTGPSTFAIDGNGYIYVAGKPTSFAPSGFAPRYNLGSANGAPIFVVRKFTPDGNSLLYESYIAASGLGTAEAMVATADGTCFIAGTTTSQDFPVTESALQQQNAGNGDGFLLKLDPTGGHLLLSTFWGGSGYDDIHTLAVDTNGNIYLGGGTSSSDFPILNAVQPTFKNKGTTGGGPSAGFVSKLDPAGKTIYSTYLTGSGPLEAVYGVAVDTNGSAFATGVSTSPDFPTTPGAYIPNPGFGGYFAFVTKFNPTGARLEYSTYLGGAFDSSIALGSDGSAVIVGNTGTLDFPVSSNALQPVNQAGRDNSSAFVVKLSPDGSAALYSRRFNHVLC
jgi:Beta-propeller repeat